jgi:uncharacterized membrane protein
MSGLTTIARGDASHVTESRRAIARTGDEWRVLWALHAGPDAQAPAVDLTRVIVAAAFAGDKPSAGHAIEISAADHAGPAGRGLELVVEERAPGPDTIAAAIITAPFHIVAVPREAGEVGWLEVGGWRSEVGGRRSEVGGRKPPQPPSSTGLEPRTASALAYLAGPFSGALILLAESRNKDVRFHAWQSIVGLGGLGLAVGVSYVIAFIALFVSATVVSLMVRVAYVIWIVLAIVWAICLWKAWSGERWKLPLVGDYAERFV